MKCEISCRFTSNFCLKENSTFLHCQTLEDTDCYIRDKINVQVFIGGLQILVNTFTYHYTIEFALLSM